VAWHGMQWIPAHTSTGLTSICECSSADFNRFIEGLHYDAFEIDNRENNNNLKTLMNFENCFEKGNKSHFRNYLLNFLNRKGLLKSFSTQENDSHSHFA